jgi:uncharacterized protein (TIGR02594 family)
MHEINEIEDKYKWLYDEPGPLMITVARKYIGTTEAPGHKDNNVIIGWAKRIGGWIASYYVRDSIAWCGLFVGYVAVASKKPFNGKMLSARSWSKWGTARRGPPMLGDVLVFWRGRPDGWKGHVGLYVAEDSDAYHVLGGNQGDKVSIVRISKSRLIGARFYYKIGQPRNVRRIFMNAEGKISTNEA